MSHRGARVSSFARLACNSDAARGTSCKPRLPFRWRAVAPNSLQIRKADLRERRVRYNADGCREIEAANAVGAHRNAQASLRLAREQIVRQPLRFFSEDQ